MHAVIGGLLIGFGLAPALLWQIFRVFNRWGVYGWESGRTVSREEARSLDESVKQASQRAEDAMRRLAPFGAILVVAGIVAAAV